MKAKITKGLTTIELDGTEEELLRFYKLMLEEKESFKLNPLPIVDPIEPLKITCTPPIGCTCPPGAWLGILPPPCPVHNPNGCLGFRTDPYYTITSISGGGLKPTYSAQAGTVLTPGMSGGTVTINNPEAGSVDSTFSGKIRFS